MEETLASCEFVCEQIRNFSTMETIKTSWMLGMAFKKIRGERGLQPSKIAQHAGRSQEILYRLECGQDITVSALLDLLRATGHGLQIVPFRPPASVDKEVRQSEDA